MQQSQPDGCGDPKRSGRLVPKMPDALLDRLRHRCTTIEINGPSLRGPE